jgi:hypothetical protein
MLALRKCVSPMIDAIVATDHTDRAALSLCAEFGAGAERDAWSKVLK